MAIMYLIVITTVACLLLLSYKLGRTTSSLKYTISLIAGIVSLSIIIISYFYGGLTGMGIGVVNFAIFIGSIISIIIILLSEIIRSKESPINKGTDPLE
ncbi:YesK family protein [Priestia aryabhattai]|uniref:YesK family protein n=1 Tax=Priestia aryabhattai TaxID=412384 RepID=UPI003D2B8A64